MYSFLEVHEEWWETCVRGMLDSDSIGDGVRDDYKYPWGNSIDGSHDNYNSSGGPWETGDFQIKTSV